MNSQIIKVLQEVDYFHKIAGLIEVPEELLSPVQSWAISCTCSKVIEDIDNIFIPNLNLVVEETKKAKVYDQYKNLIEKYFKHLNKLKIVCRSFIKKETKLKAVFSFPVKKILYFKDLDKEIKDKFITINCNFQWKDPSENEEVGGFDFNTGLSYLLDSREGKTSNDKIIHLGKLSIVNFLLINPSISTFPLEFINDPANSRYISLEEDILPLINQIKETVKHELIHAMQFFMSIVINKYYNKETEIIPRNVALEGGPSKKLSPIAFDPSKEKFDVYSLEDSKKKKDKKELEDFFEEEEIFLEKMRDLNIPELFQLDFAKLWTNQISLDEFKKLTNINLPRNNLFPRKFFSLLKNENPDKYKTYAKQFLISPVAASHPLKEQEFYTRLSDEIDNFNYYKKYLPLQFHKEFARAWVDSEYYPTFENNLLKFLNKGPEFLKEISNLALALKNCSNRLFFKALFKDHPNKYEKAVKEFIKYTM